jgi:hypothetical protein
MFWGTPDASIRFGEPKYAWSPWVFEFFNTLSSLFYVVVALGFRVPGRPVRAHELALILVGLSSALFHATGRRWAQLADEFSMIAWTWAVLQSMDDHAPRRLPLMSRLLALVTVSLMSFYAVHGHFLWFFVVFSLHVLRLVRGLMSLELSPWDKASCLLIFGAAMVFWALEQLDPNFWVGHVGWHACSAVAAGLLHLCMELDRVALERKSEHKSAQLLAKAQ